MDNIFIDKIKGKKFTKTQKKIAEYFVENQHALLQKSLLQISKEIEVSDVSVLRFVRSLGYEGYNDLKNELYLDLEKNMNEMSLTTRLGVKSSVLDQANTLEKYVEQSKVSIEHSLKRNHQESYQQVVDLLGKSKRKYIIGFRGGSAPALQFSRTLNLIVDDVYGIIDNTPDLYIKLRAIEKGDVVILFSFTRYYHMDIDISEYVKEKGAVLCVITDTATSPAAVAADIILLVDIDNISFFNSNAAVNSLSEYILILFANKNRESIKERLDEFDRLTGKYRY